MSPLEERDRDVESWELAARVARLEADSRPGDLEAAAWAERAEETLRLCRALRDAGLAYYENLQAYPEPSKEAWDALLAAADARAQTA